MKPFHSITALLLALLVAVPLCCCTALGSDAPAPSKCCMETEDGQQDNAPKICACKVGEPRDEAKAFVLPGDLDTPFIPVVQDLGYLSQPLLKRSPMANTPHTGCDPPRLLLARFSRWLI